MQNPRFFKYSIPCRLGVAGPDAGEFLQGQFSNDLSEIAVGGVVYGLWLDRKGKIVADSFVLRRTEERFLVMSYHCDEETVNGRLDPYLIMEEAELERSSGDVFARCVFGGPAQESVCSALGLPLPERGSFSEDAGVVAFWGRRCEDAALEIVFFGNESASCIEKADACLRVLGAQELDAEAVAALSIEAKVARIGLGFGDSDLPQELGLEVDAVSFRKGCYLGQEVMARLHAMGKVRKELRRVSIGEPNTISAADLPLDLLDADGKRQGQLRSIAYPKSGGVGLAVVSSGFSGGVLRAGAVELMLDGEEDAAHG